ncbi:SDR family NAD(P)-dependent oxidoreductase [Szabonella alba]|uniref:SDR family oxidoreductase n=1 Tax=Szabonella alba TaxID=2804194 RepID=A0A8K0VBP0_9RHOB|nr:SDR family NAD(P)-dependent oxidoreductase [Szabonella alba]MBL4919132.1 SDR family oxidoreductase [Szabonella alba]
MTSAETGKIVSGQGLSGRTVLVFGAGTPAGGISNGLAAGLAYARAGAGIFAVDSHPESLEHTLTALRAAGADAAGACGDIRSDSDVEHCVAAAGRAFGQIDVLHNNVGVLRLGGPDALSKEDWTLSINTNLTGAFLAVRHVVPQMKHRRRGVIINVSSIAGSRFCGKPMIAYSASKAALEQLTRSIAVELAPFGIRCNAVAPGLIDTAMAMNAYANGEESAGQVRRDRDALSPTGRMGRPEDVANAAVFLASDAAAYINGAVLPVDGGLACRCW